MCQFRTKWGAVPVHVQNGHARGHARCHRRQTDGAHRRAEVERQRRAGMVRKLQNIRGEDAGLALALRAPVRRESSAVLTGQPSRNNAGMMKQRQQKTRTESLFQSDWGLQRRQLHTAAACMSTRVSRSTTKNSQGASSWLANEASTVETLMLVIIRRRGDPHVKNVPP